MQVHLGIQFFCLAAKTDLLKQTFISHYEQHQFDFLSSDAGKVALKKAQAPNSHHFSSSQALTQTSTIFYSHLHDILERSAQSPVSPNPQRITRPLCTWITWVERHVCLWIHYSFIHSSIYSSTIN